MPATAAVRPAAAADRATKEDAQNGLARTQSAGPVGPWMCDDRRMVQRPPAILVLTGASGAGKSTLLRELEALRLPGVFCAHCDAVYDDLPEQIRADGAAAQDALLAYGVNQALGGCAIDLAVLDTQIRPHKARALLERMGIRVYRIVLVECEPLVRNRRLWDLRERPDLASAQMDNWAAYLAGQADALELPRIDTSAQPLPDSVGQLRVLVEELRLAGATLRSA